MTDFDFTELLPLGPDATTYRRLDIDGVSTVEAGGHTFPRVEATVLTVRAAEAMHDIAHYLPAGHLAQLARILEDPEASANDRFLEELERHPAQFLPEITSEELGGDVVAVDLDRPMDEIRSELTKYPVRTRLSLCLRRQRRLLPGFHRRTRRPARPGLHPQGRGARVPRAGMEAVWRIEVEDFPAFIVVDDKGNDFFAQVTAPVSLGR